MGEIKTAHRDITAEVMVLGVVLSLLSVTETQTNSTNSILGSVMGTLGHAGMSHLN